MKKGVIIYNYGLKHASYLQNLQLYSMGLGLELISNKSLQLLYADNHTRKPAFDYCVFLDKDMNIAKALELHGIKLFNSAFAIAVCDNKAYTHIHLANHHIPMPKTFIPPMTYYNPEFICPLPYPVVIKECYGSLGEQVYLAQNESQARKIVDKIGNKPYIIQEFLEADNTDYRLFTVGHKVICCMKRHNPTDFRANCELGGNATSYHADANMIHLAESVSKALQLDFGGIDIIKRKDKYYVIEANASAMIRSLTDATGIDVTKPLKAHIENKTSGAV